MYTLHEIMKLTNQDRESIEFFINELKKYKVKCGYEFLNKNELEVFKKGLGYSKNNDKNLTLCMHRAIQEEYGEDLTLPFYWDKKLIIQQLIDQIRRGEVSITKHLLSAGLQSDLGSILQVITTNFLELGKTHPTYAGSHGGAGSAGYTFMLSGKDYMFLLIGKRNYLIEQEESHLFYNEGLEFNMMRCRHITGGPVEKGMMKKLLDLCYEMRPNGSDSEQ
ncbi:hypothetical protein [Paenibacillus sp. Leaf72]|uniref:hypothetical protein n=1 Tax=Paenibacillus sp. Leaf72 TaxID=1736234 RepID=UPI000701671C|nr:hypothetical protein [Paenibacillus sp. Leaf72]KQN96980.1 hypothetical protein ASF12_23210 [Paenibacillus sp. Leaf72]